MSSFEEVINYTNSTVVKTVLYSKEQQYLIVGLQNGKAYLYYDFPETEVIKFQRASSLGKFWNESVKNKYTSTHY